jgi:hypothetical protein
MTNTTTTAPTVPLPPGFVSAGDWQKSGSDKSYRLVFGADQTVTDHDARISTHAFQFEDGSIAIRWDSEAPSIAVLNGNRDTGLWPLSSDQARELAAALLGRGRGDRRVESAGLIPNRPRQV